MELATLLLALGIVLQWTRFQVALGLMLLPLQPSISCFYTIEIDEEVTAFITFGYPLSLGFSFALGNYISLQLTLPPQVEKAQFFEFYKYLEETGLLKSYTNAIKTILKDEVLDERSGLLILQNACGGVVVDNVDTTKLKEEIEACKLATENAKEELKDIMLKFMDAIERSTSDDVFIETELSKTGKHTYNRAACLLKEFGCITKTKDIRRLRKERGIEPAKVTAAMLSQKRIAKYLTASEQSFLRLCHNPVQPSSPEVMPAGEGDELEGKEMQITAQGAPPGETEISPVHLSK